MRIAVGRRATWGLAGGAVLGVVWLGPLEILGGFTGHMVMHMAVVAVAAPLLALAVAGTRLDLVQRAPARMSPVVASVVELVLVWGWHAPRLHHLARHDALGLVFEQLTFLLSGGFLWMSALGGVPSRRRERAVAGVAGLLLTSMHMTLLGAILALSPRLLYGGHGVAPDRALADQHAGGLVMIFGGGVVYLLGGVGLAREALLAKGTAAARRFSGEEAR